MVCGAEALDTRRRLKKAGSGRSGATRTRSASRFPSRPSSTTPRWLTRCSRRGSRSPCGTSPAVAHLGVEPDVYRRQLGELLAPMTEFAAANPYAWFPQERGVNELIEPTPENRLVAIYTKYMVSVMDVDMAGALVLTSHEKADDLGIPADRRVYLRGWSYATDPVYVAERPAMRRSPAMREGQQGGARSGGGGHHDVAHLDLYSCFASSINFALDARHRTRRPPGHGHRRPPARRRRGQRLHDPLDRDDGRRPAQRPGHRARVRRRDAHDQARLRRVWHRARAGGGARRRTGAVPSRG